MKLYHVVAMAEGRVIGKDNKLPWHFPADLKFFKQLTTGSTVIMGRKTFESIGRPLPNRENFILTRSLRHPEHSEGSAVQYFSSFEEAKKKIKTEKAYIIGGAQIFEQTLNAVDGIYLTQIYEKFGGDTFYPEVPKVFKEKSRTALQENPKIEVIYFEKDPMPHAPCP